MRALSLCGRLRVMIAILPWVDRVICSSRVDILSFSLLLVGRKCCGTYTEEVVAGKSIQNETSRIHNHRKN